MESHAQRLAQNIGGPTKHILLGTFETDKANPGGYRRGMDNLAALGLIDATGRTTELGDEVKRIVQASIAPL